MGSGGNVVSIGGIGVQDTIYNLATTPGQSSLASGTVGNVPWTSDLAGFSDGTNDHVFFIGADGYVHEFFGGVNAPFSQWTEHRIGSGGAFIP